MLLIAAVGASVARAAADPVSSVDPFVGTGGDAGHTFPGAVLPHGMVQFSPVSGRTTSPGGYRYDDRTIRGFALTRLSGAGCANLGDLPVMPLTRPFAKVGADPGGTPLATFRHDAESASPGRYRVAFSNGVRTSLTATLRTGDATFVFPGSNAYLSLDPGGGATDQAAISIAAAGPTEVRGSVTD